MAKAKKRGGAPKRVKISNEVDQVVALGVELERLQDRYNDLTGESGQPATSESVYRHAEMDHLSDRIDALREYISSVKATTLRGATVQIAAALVELDIARDHVKEPAAMESQLRKIVRLLYSAGNVIDTHCARPKGLQPISDHLDPLVEYERRMERAGLRRGV